MDFGSIPMGIRRYAQPSTSCFYSIHSTATLVYIVLIAVVIQNVTIYRPHIHFICIVGTIFREKKSTPMNKWGISMHGFSTWPPLLSSAAQSSLCASFSLYFHSIQNAHIIRGTAAIDFRESRSYFDCAPMVRRCRSSCKNTTYILDAL